MLTINHTTQNNTNATKFTLNKQKAFHLTINKKEYPKTQKLTMLVANERRLL